MTIDRPITIALILFIILLLVFFLVMPEYRTFGKLQTEFGEKKAEFNAEFDYYAAITKTHLDLQNHQDDIKKIDDALPQEPNLGKLVYFFQQTAAANGMFIKGLFLSKSSLSNAQSEANNNVQDILFSIDLLGDYPSLEKFIVALEKSSRIFEITNISFNSSPETSAQSVQSQPAQSQFQMQQTYGFNLQIKTHSY